MPDLKIRILAAGVIIALTLFVWSLATPIWLAPDEPHHFLNAYIISEHVTIPENKFYDLPIAISKSKAASNLFSYIIEGSTKRVIYDKQSSPFEEDIDKPIDINEVEALFLTLSAWDLEPLSIPAWEPDFSSMTPAEVFNLEQQPIGWEIDNNNIIIKSDSVSIKTSLLNSVLIEGKKSPYLLYGIKYQGAFKTLQWLSKTPGIIVSGSEIIKIIDQNDSNNISTEDGVISFKKYPSENILIKILPIGKESFKQHTYYFYFPPLYYSLVAGTIKVAGIFGSGIIGEVFLARLFSVMLGVMSLFFIYKIFIFIWPDDKQSAIAGMLLFSFWPMNSFVFSIISADALLNLFCTAAFYYLIRIVFSKEISSRDWIILSMVATLAAFTKLAGALLILIWWPLLILLLLFVRKERFKPIFLLPPGMMFVGPYLMWHLWNPPFLAGTTLAGLSLSEFIRMCLDYHFLWVFKSFAGNFGSLRNPMPEFAYSVLILFITVILGLFIYGLVKKSHKDNRSNYFYIFVCTVLSILAGFVMEFTKIDTFGFFLQGRHFLFLVTPLVILARAATRYPDKSIKVIGEVVFNLFVISVIIINGYALFNYIAQNFS